MFQERTRDGILKFGVSLSDLASTAKVRFRLEVSLKQGERLAISASSGSGCTYINHSALEVLEIRLFVTSLDFLDM